MYESAYNKLFWGMMFIIFNINLGVINIMPDFIGYALIMSGLNILTKQHSIFEKGKIPAVILCIITLKDIVNLGTVDLLNGGFQMSSPWLTAIGVVESLLKLYLIYIICRGIYLLAEERGLTELKDSIKGRFYFYFALQLVMLFYIPFSLNISRNISPLMILVVIINIIAALFIAGLFRKSKTQLGEGGEDLNV